MLWGELIMVLVQGIKGKTMFLRPVEVTDAEFIVKIRNDETLARYLHPVSTSVKAQEQWISKQRERAGDYYFIICGVQGESLGAVRLSGIAENSGEVGSLISYGNPAQNMEAEMRITDFAFEEVGLDYLQGYTLANNKPVIGYHKKFGYVYEEEEKIVDGMVVRFARLEKDTWKRNRGKIERLIEHVG